MEWKVVDTVISPSTGVSFSCVHSLKNLRLTLWYQADVYMPPGSIIIPFNKGVLINDKLYPVTVYNVTRFNPVLWKSLKENSHCPGNCNPKPEACSYPFECLVSVCPFGLTRNIQIDNKKV
ncbi:anti-adapter protein IraM [Salmonella enterica subsp. enterica]|nr:anti-adapter protein IraM [Salmonella enterica subsp. enterica serovar Nima]EHO5799599.1 anti-adapter protein IraM [Salmonella enterica]EBY2095514.1 anti-adapter protein IraM [Salmonella enterica subsp. enterica serovar Nima]ECD2903458.1 anti-adapter protein IraM [Salmonella enterica subsp. enterica serovar Nima]ECF3726495.1 anti-adapter protein IraM [Salmonella enterica subsp. enterica serovar Nima]